MHECRVCSSQPSSSAVGQAEKLRKRSRKDQVCMSVTSKLSPYCSSMVRKMYSICTVQSWTTKVLVVHGTVYCTVQCTVYCIHEVGADTLVKTPTKLSSQSEQQSDRNVEYGCSRSYKSLGRYVSILLST